MPYGLMPASLLIFNYRFNMSDLELDFKEIAKQINERIKNAAKEMEEANKLAKSIGLKSMTYYDYADPEDLEDSVVEEIRDIINISPLFSQLDKAGWETSSIGC
jgi:cytoplasmic iron level regulating protein YaaA (DUF328/UPF0246 family)